MAWYLFSKSGNYVFFNCTFLLFDVLLLFNFFFIEFISFSKFLFSVNNFSFLAFKLLIFVSSWIVEREFSNWFLKSFTSSSNFFLFSVFILNFSAFLASSANLASSAAFSFVIRSTSRRSASARRSASRRFVSAFFVFLSSHNAWILSRLCLAAIF